MASGRIPCLDLSLVLRNSDRAGVGTTESRGAAGLIHPFDPAQYDGLNVPNISGIASRDDSRDRSGDVVIRSHVFDCNVHDAVLVDISMCRVRRNCHASHKHASSDGGGGYGPAHGIHDKLRYG